MQELLDVVDEKNEIIGIAPYDEIYSKKLNHRIVHVLVFNSKGEIFLQQRSAKQKFCPGHWFTSSSAHVRNGESCEAAAVRSISEQLALNTPVARICEIEYDHYKMRKFVSVFRAVSEGPFRLNEEETAKGMWFSAADACAIVRKNQLVHPELACVIEKLFMLPQAL